MYFFLTRSYHLLIILTILFIHSYNIYSEASKNKIDNLNELNLQTLLNKITFRMQSGNRYTLFSPDGSGFGNLARGMSTTLALALVTNRKFIVDTKSSYFELFDEPSINFSIKKSHIDFSRFSKYPHKLLVLGKATKEYAINIDGSLKSKHDYIEHNCGCSFAQYFYNNDFKDIWKKIFDIDLRWDEIDVLLIMWLFQNPKPLLIHNSYKVLDSINWFNYTEHVVVQYRGFVDVISKSGVTLKEDVRLITEQVHLHQSHLDMNIRDNILIYVTSDSFAWSTLLRDHLKKFFKNVVVSNMYPNTHSAKASPNTLTRTQGMIDWFILGIAKDVICTGTTYCISARARVGMGSPYWYNESQSSSSTIMIGPDAPFNNYKLQTNSTLTMLLNHKFLATGGTTVRYQMINLAASLHDAPPYNGHMTAINQPLPWFYLH